MTFIYSGKSSEHPSCASSCWRLSSCCAVKPSSHCTHCSKTHQRAGQGNFKSSHFLTCSVVCLIWIVFNSRPSVPEQLSPVQPKQRDSGSRRNLRMVPLVRQTGLNIFTLPVNLKSPKGLSKFSLSSKESEPLTCFYTDNLNKFPLRPEQLAFFSGPVPVTLLAVGKELWCQGQDTKVSH